MLTTVGNSEVIFSLTVCAAVNQRVIFAEVVIHPKRAEKHQRRAAGKLVKLGGCCVNEKVGCVVQDLA